MKIKSCGMLTKIRSLWLTLHDCTEHFPSSPSSFGIGSSSLLIASKWKIRVVRFSYMAHFFIGEKLAKFGLTQSDW